MRSDDDWLAGLALGAACSLKPFAAVVVFLFLVLRRFRAVGTAVTVYALIAAVMTLRFGWSGWPLFLAKQKEVADVWLDSIHNQSLNGIVHHLFRPTCTRHGPVIAGAALLSSALSLALIAGACWLAHRLPRTRDSAEALLAAFIPLAIFTSQWAWPHYDVILVLPFAVSANQLSRLWRSGVARRWVLLGAAALIGVVATVRIPIYAKESIQRAVWRGNLRDHVLLHVLEALNSAPTVFLLAVTFGVVIERLRHKPASGRLSSSYRGSFGRRGPRGRSSDRYGRSNRASGRVSFVVTDSQPKRSASTSSGSGASVALSNLCWRRTVEPTTPVTPIIRTSIRRRATREVAARVRRWVPLVRRYAEPPGSTR